MTGAFVCVVGPSGAGKDTLIAGAREALAGDARFVFPRRVVTRAASAFEDHDRLTPDEFAKRQAEGGFALSWNAHGLSYGIPSSVRADLAAGRVLVCNLSRAAVEEARSQLPAVRTVLVTAPRDVLRQRILSRGRETPEEVERRLDREAAVTTPADLTLVNVGPAGDQVSALARFLRGLADPAKLGLDRLASA